MSKSDKNNPFEERLKAAYEKQNPAGAKNKTGSKANMGKNSRLLHIGSEIIGGVIAGFILGYIADYFLKTHLLFSAIFAVAGIFIGLYNAYRYFTKITQDDEQDE